MAVKGAVAKQAIFDKLKEIYPDAFTCAGGKEFRIPYVENGEQVEIKVALTCAKENVGAGVTSGSTVGENPAMPSKKEQEDLKNLMARLGL